MKTKFGLIFLVRSNHEEEERRREEEEEEEGGAKKGMKLVWMLALV